MSSDLSPGSANTRRARRILLAYSFHTWTDGRFTVSGTGVTNSSGITQELDVSNVGSIVFKNSATAGNSLMNYTLDGGSIVFEDTSTAGATTVQVTDSNPAALVFNDTSSGGTSRIVVNGGTLDISGHAPPVSPSARSKESMVWCYLGVII